MAELSKEQAEIVSRLAAEHEDVASFSLKRTGDLIVVRKCKPVERARFVDRISKRDTSEMSVALKELTLACVVFPENRDEAKALLDRFPALYDKLANTAYQLATGDIEELGKD